MTLTYIWGETGLVGFGCKEFYVVAIPRKIAVDVIIKKHYSHRIVNNSYVHLGVYINSEFIGVLQFGYMLNPRCCGAVVKDTIVTEYLELNRMWLDDKAKRNSESRALSYAIKYIKKACPAVAWIQSYADERCGGWGITYQAANFLYCGYHISSFYELDGETYHKLLLTAVKRGGRRGVYLRENFARAKEVRLKQFRYIYFRQPLKKGFSIMLF